MADSFGTVEFDIVRPDSGLDPLPEYPSYGSARHVANSSRDIIQYTGVGPGRVTYHILFERADYDDLLALYRAYPRVADTLTTIDGDMGDWFIEAIASPALQLDGRVSADVTFREG